MCLVPCVLCRSSYDGHKMILTCDVDSLDCSLQYDLSHLQISCIIHHVSASDDVLDVLDSRSVTATADLSVQDTEDLLNSPIQ